MSRDRNGGLWHIEDALWSCGHSSVGRSLRFASCSICLFPSTSPALQPALLLLLSLIGMLLLGCMGPKQYQPKSFSVSVCKSESINKRKYKLKVKGKNIWRKIKNRLKLNKLIIYIY